MPNPYDQFVSNLSASIPDVMPGVGPHGPNSWMPFFENHPQVGGHPFAPVGPAMAGPMAPLPVGNNYDPPAGSIPPKFTPSGPINGGQMNFGGGGQQVQNIMNLLQQRAPQLFQQIQNTPGGFLAWLNQAIARGFGNQPQVQHGPAFAPVGPAMAPPPRRNPFVPPIGG